MGDGISGWVPEDWAHGSAHKGGEMGVGAASSLIISGNCAIPFLAME